MVQSSRLEGFDLARSLAVFGMVIVNYRIVMCGVEPSSGIWAWFTGLFEGRAAACFVVLAGVGLTLMSARSLRENDSAAFNQVRAKLLRRALFLLICGLAYSPIWPADILHFYAFYILFGVLLLRAGDNRTAGITAALVLLSPVLLVVFDYSAEWDWETLTYQGFWTLSGMFKHIFYNGFHPVVPWAAFLLMGMLLGRLDVRDRIKRRKVGLVAGLIALLTEIASHFFTGIASTVMTNEDATALFRTGPMPPNPFYMVAAGAIAIAIIVICLELAERLGQRLQPLYRTGRLALTHYVAHVVLGMSALHGLGLIGDQSAGVALLAATCFFAGAILFSQIWVKFTPRGPLEWVMRKICG